MIKALDHCGKLVLAKEPFSIQEAWFIAKNDNSGMSLTELRSYSAIWKAKQLFGCGYDQAVEVVVEKLSNNLCIKSAHHKKELDC